MGRNNGDFHNVSITHSLSGDGSIDIRATHPEHGQIGDMVLGAPVKGVRKVGWINVAPAHQRKGVATAMWNYAQNRGLKPAHSAERTDEGNAWAASVGGKTPVRDGEVGSKDELNNVQHNTHSELVSNIHMLESHVFGMNKQYENLFNSHPGVRQFNNASQHLVSAMGTDDHAQSLRHLRNHVSALKSLHAVMQSPLPQVDSKGREAMTYNPSEAEGVGQAVEKAQGLVDNYARAIREHNTAMRGL